jgi:hypothetical protein
MPLVVLEALIKEEEGAACCDLFSILHTRTHRYYTWYQNTITLFDCMFEESLDFKLGHLAFWRDIVHGMGFEYKLMLLIVVAVVAFCL